MGKKPGITERLRSEIEASDMTLYKIAQQAEISLSMLARFMNHERDLQLSTVHKICDVLGLELVRRK